MINVGILGFANIAMKEFIPAINLNSDFNLYAIASRNNNIQSKIENLSNKVKLYGYEELINDPIIDLVYIPLPNSLHFEWTIKALKKQKHVIVEKPLCLDIYEFEKIYRLAKKNKLIVFENFAFKFHTQNISLKKMLNTKVIGDVRLLKTSFGFPPFENSNNIRYDKNLGGGSLYDAGVYPIKLTTFLFGNNFDVVNSNLFYIKRKEVDIYGNGVLNSPTGITSQISFGFDNYYQCSCEIWGSTGVLKNNRVFTAKDNYEATIEIYSNSTKDVEILKFPTENQFSNMLDYVKKLIFKNDYESELEESFVQIKLVSSFLRMSKSFNL